MFKFTGLIAVSAFVAVATLASPSPFHGDTSSLTRRSLAGQSIAFSCYGGGGDCECPTDLTGDSNGVLINVYPGYQCAYPGGACTWDDKVSNSPIPVAERIAHRRYNTCRRVPCRTPLRPTARSLRRATRSAAASARPTTTTTLVS